MTHTKCTVFCLWGDFYWTSVIKEKYVDVHIFEKLCFYLVCFWLVFVTHSLHVTIPQFHPDFLVKQK
jgi:hypothetical protein